MALADNRTPFELDAFKALLQRQEARLPVGR
jgi:hypothetical protein